MRTITISRPENLPIGALSRLSGVNIETIRYYERIKMLAAPRRTGGGRRIYDSRDLRVLVFIRRSRELGFSLDQIALFYASVVPKGPLAARYMRSPRIICSISGPSSAIWKSLNGC